LEEISDALSLDYELVASALAEAVATLREEMTDG